MPSQPDYTQAYKLSPKLAPKDPAEVLRKQNDELVAKLAEAQGKTPEEVRKDLEQDALPANDKPITKPSNDNVDQGPAVVTREEAQFFANKEGKKYYPIADREKGPMAKLGEDKTVYFKTEDDAKGASFVAA
jgi:hypothetical protein